MLAADTVYTVICCWKASNGRCLGRWEREVGQKGDRTNCLQPGCCWLCAGQLCLQLLLDTRRAGLAGGTLTDDAWLQLHSVPLSRQLLPDVLAAKTQSLGAPGAASESLWSGGLWRPVKVWEARSSVQLETFPALALPLVDRQINSQV